MNSSEWIFWEQWLNGEEGYSPDPFQKKSSLLAVFHVYSWCGQPAYFLGKQGVTDAMFLSEIAVFQNLLLYNLLTGNR